MNNPNQPQVPDRLVPTFRDRATAMRLVLAMLNSDTDAISLIATEAKTGDDIDRLILAMADEFRTLAQKCMTDPIGEVEKWIAHNLHQADKLGQ